MAALAQGANIEGGPSDSRDTWLRTRNYLNAHRHELTLAAARGFKSDAFIPGTRLLARHGWIPELPVPLQNVQLAWVNRAPSTAVSGDAAELDHIRPLRDDGSPYARYAEAVDHLARPRLFENRVCYRLLDVAGTTNHPSLTFGPGAYFDVIDICEAAAHEFAAAHMNQRIASPVATPFRAALGDPTDLGQRPILGAISTLTIRLDQTTGDADFVLHWRDPLKVASGGGLYQVIPVGMFQPSHDALWNLTNDFDLWRSISRELSEELLGSTEDYGSATHPIDYDGWDFYETLSEAREQGRLRVYWLGLGVDPLTYVTDMLTVAVFDADLFDQTFRCLVAANDEGHLVAVEDAIGHATGIPFRADHITRLTHFEPLQPAGAALLHLAWKHRAELLHPQDVPCDPRNASE